MENKNQSSGALPYLPVVGAPSWFLDNISQPGESRYAPYAGGSVHFLSWNWDNESLPVLMFVHGFVGHARWWSFLAPFFSDRYRIAAIDLPGMGDSDALSEYNDDCFARGILAVIDEYQLPAVTIIGHSFGGVQSIRAMALRPEVFIRGIVVDSLVQLPPEDILRMIDGKTQHKQRVDQNECIQSFRLGPPQPNLIPALHHYIAYHSCAGDEHGWYWKFDPALRNFGEIYDATFLQKVTTKVDCVYGGNSIFSTDNRPARILASFANGGQLVIIADAYHHIMLDCPLELVDAINNLLAGSHSLLAENEEG